MIYSWMVRLLKQPRASNAWRRWRARRGDDVGSYSRIPEYVKEYAPGRTFADIGCMWGVNGEYSFLAEEVGAAAVRAVDVFGPTPEFEEHHRAAGSAVDFVLGDISRAETAARVGVCDVVLCAGVLYHHPSPYDLLVALRRIYGDVLILRTSTIPEVPGLPNAAIYYPRLGRKERQLYDLRSLGLQRQVGITDGFEPEQGYGNWFWGLTPSCLASLVETAGFRIERRAPEAFAQTLICRTADAPFRHRLPGEAESREMARDISATGIARPA